MNAAGIIFSDSFDAKIDELTDKRTMSAIPYAGKYRLIDFPISNMVNAGVSNIGIITKKNYQSLMGHCRSGSVWDLDRKNDGLTILSPFSTINQTDEDVYVNRLEGLINNINYLRNLDEEYIVITGCGFIWNIDLEDMLAKHIDSGARMTLLYTKNPYNKKAGVNATYVSVDENHMVTGLDVSDEKPEEMRLSLNTFILKRKDLVDILNRAIREKKSSFRWDITLPMIEAGEVRGYETKEKVLCFENLTSYLESSLDLLDRDVLNALFHNENGPIITPARDSAPTRYGEDCLVENSLIADGAIIEGEVRNSIIFRGVRIGKGAVVENSVVMQDAIISDGAKVNYAVLDKYCVIEEGRLLSGYITHPFYCERNGRI